MDRDAHGQHDGRDQRADHQPDRVAGVGAGAAVHRRHVLLVQDQNRVGALPNLVEGRQQLAEIDLGLALGGSPAVEKSLGVLEVLSEQAIHRIGERRFARERDVRFLGLQVLETRGRFASNWSRPC